MMTTIAYTSKGIVGVYSDINRAKRGAKEKLPYSFKRVKYIVFELNDGVTDEAQIDKESSTV